MLLNMMTNEIMWRGRVVTTLHLAKNKAELSEHTRINNYAIELKEDK